MDNLDKISDVIVRFCAHEQYGSKDKAIKALSKRVDNDLINCRNLFEKHILIYNKTVDLVVKKIPNSSKYNDLVFQEIKDEICKMINCSMEEAGAYINWCYFYFILK